MNGGGFRADLNGLRGVSVALVVLFHLQVKGATGSFIGVDVFFVLSGYLMTKIILGGLEEGVFGYWRFIGARAARIWPALAALIVSLLVLGWWWLPPFDLQTVAEQARMALLFVSNHYFMGRSGYITQTGDTLWLLHTWSLSVEWQFYMLYPLLLMGVQRMAGPVRSRLWALRVVVVLVAVSIGLQWTTSRADPDAAFFLLPGRCWELLAGGLAFLLQGRQLRGGSLGLRWHAVASYAGLAIVLASALLLAAMRRGPVGAGLWLVLPVVGTMLILWAGHDRNVVLRSPALQHLGSWSYSVYLWHWPLIVAMRMTEIPLTHPVLASTGILAASLLMGWLSFTLIERPGAARHAATVLRRAFKPVVVMLAAVGSVSIVLSTDGLSSRLRGHGDPYRDYWASIHPLYFPDDCSNYKRPVPQLKACSIRKSGPARVLVIGDSHAEHYYAWFSANSTMSVDFFTAAECPPVPNFERMQSGYVCQDYAAIAWGKAIATDYDTVIVAARWATIGLAGAPYCHRAPSRTCVPPPTVSAKQLLVIDELKAAVRTVLRAGKTVVMVDSAPESRLRVPERLAREQFWFGQVRWTVRRSSLAEQTGWMEPVFAEFDRTPGFHRVSLRDTLCQGESCRTYDESMKRPIFFDESHFDPIWIASQNDLFARFVRTR